MFKDIRNIKKQLSNLTNQLTVHGTRIDRLTERIRDIKGTADGRHERLNYELKRLEPKKVKLSHVDAPNVKVEYDLADVVQALVDRFDLGYLPPEEAQIVVLRKK